MFQNAPSALDSGRSAASPQILGGTLGTRPVSAHALQFTGSGSEYFRIWIVNLLLMLVTLGLYYPWAKVRKLRYFYGNTLVMGHPLDFHGEPRKMLRGFLLVSLLMILYSAAGHASPVAGGIAGALLALIWPALMRASLQFRLAQTSWRGLRFHFTGTLKQAYMVFLSPLLVMVGIALLAGILATLLPPTLALQVFGGIMVLAMIGIGPYTLWRLKQFQHANYALGQLQTSFRATYPDVLRIFIKTGALALLLLLSFGVLSGLLMVVRISSASNATAGLFLASIYAKAMMPLMILGYVLFAQVLQGPYFISRMQNLVWTETGNRLVRFKSNLDWGPLALLSLRHWILVIVTLGLYWPFAAVALARARLEAVVIHTRQDPDMLVAQMRQDKQDPTGDMAADLIGIDLGL